jgi:hypothetical protein
MMQKSDFLTIVVSLALIAAASAMVYGFLLPHL